MTDPKAVAAWMGRVQETFNALKWAPYDAQERACQFIAGRDGDEAAAKLKELFAAFEKQAAEITAKLDVGEAEAVKPVVKPATVVVEKPKAQGAKPRPGWRRDFRSKPKSDAAVKAVVASIIETAKPKLLLAEPTEDRKPVGSKLGVAPGLVGEIADFTLGSAMYPSWKFAVAGSVVVIGSLIGRRIAGPSGPLGTGTHLYLVAAGPTGSGKEHLRTVTKLLLTTVGAAELIGPGRFKSGAGIIGHLVNKPVSLCVMDEFGSTLARLTAPNAQFYYQDETEILRELWGISWSRYDSPEGASSDSEAVISPALSIIGMSTPKELYKACKSRDVTNGFLNRWWFVEEKAVPEYQRVGPEALIVPNELKVSLGRLYQPGTSMLDQVADGTEFRPSFRMSWGRGAEEVYDAIRQSVEREADERKRELFWRSAEKTVRIATNVAAGCLSKTVEREHMEFSYKLVKESDETLLVGVQEYMEEEKYEFGELCREIIRRIRQAGGGMSRRDVGRSFQNNLKFGPELWRAIDHLAETEQVVEQKVETGGRPTMMYWLPPKERPKKSTDAG